MVFFRSGSAVRERRGSDERGTTKSELSALQTWLQCVAQLAWAKCTCHVDQSPRQTVKVHKKHQT
jgi:hypothetical protein